ncbi:MAG: xanthine phosphoribosyltransferase [Candidatus Promineifilaceae bacterium]|nr:xanthine phosphoribosyltransferase [Candidatus Promineifilaceae bacterium]
MKALRERIKREATYIGRGIIKVDGFLNHQVDPALTTAMGEAFARRFDAAGVRDVTRVLTAEVSGIAPAMATAAVLDVPMVYARKHRPITMPDGFYLAEAPSHTKGGVVRLMISPEFLEADDRVLIIDDFLATGKTIEALVRLVKQSGAILLGIGCVVEKVFEPGRDRLAQLGVPLVSLARLDLDGDEIVVLKETEATAA